MPMTTVFQSLANAAGASASAAASDTPATTDFSSSEPIIPLPPGCFFQAAPLADLSGVAASCGNPNGVLQAAWPIGNAERRPKSGPKRHPRLGPLTDARG